MQFLQLLGRGGSNRRDSAAANVAHIMELTEEIFEKGCHAVGARKYEPIIRVEFQQRITSSSRLVGGSILIVGTSSTSAPSSLNWPAKEADCSRLRVTTTFWPN